MSKKQAEDRKARLEQVRREQQAAERRRTLLITGVAGALVLVLVGAVAVVISRQIADSDITKVGVAAAAANCDPITTDPVSGSGDHVGPGTNTPNETTVKYSTVPPTSGKHFASPEYPNRAFYTAQDTPKVETLVHNLEHGYTVLWYAPSVSATTKAELEKVADLARRSDNAGEKFIVAPLDTSRGELPAGKTVALSHWGLKSGHRQLCGGLSGEVVKDFVKKYPSSDSPEPNAQ